MMRWMSSMLSISSCHMAVSSLPSSFSKAFSYLPFTMNIIHWFLGGIIDFQVPLAPKYFCGKFQHWANDCPPVWHDELFHHAQYWVFLRNWHVPDRWRDPTINIVDKPKRQRSVDGGSYPDSPSGSLCQIQALASKQGLISPCLLSKLFFFMQAIMELLLHNLPINEQHIIHRNI